LNLKITKLKFNNQVKKNLLKISLLAFSGIIASCQQTEKKEIAKADISYPQTTKTNAVDTYFGIQVNDPYRWLENDTSAETAEWVNNQNEITQNYLSQIPYRTKLKDRLSQLFNYPRYTAPIKKENNLFYMKNDGLQNQSVLYMQEGINGPSKVLLDPNTLSADGTVSISQFNISNNGKYLAYSLAKGGSDWNEIYVIDLESGNTLVDHLQWIKFTDISWQADGFYYSCYDAPKKGEELSGQNKYHKVKYHKIGTGQQQDQLIYDNPEKELRYHSAQVTDDEQFLIIYASEGTDGVELYYKNLKNGDKIFTQFNQGFEYEFWVADNTGQSFFVRTNYKAPNWKLLQVDVKNPQENKWKDLIPESKNVMSGIHRIKDKFVITYMQDANSKAYVYNLNGRQEKEISLPAIGDLTVFNSNKEDDLAFYSYVSFTFPSKVFQYDLNSNQSKEYFETKLKFNPYDYETKQVFYTSKDGTKIPMFITHKKGLKPNGSSPTLLYGYGGFNISITPAFKAERMLILENGGIFASANLRGGGEYGEEWHKAGKELNKQNVFDDFIAAAEYLIKEKYTSPDHLVISGRSNGGLLVGAVANQRPDLFKVALPAVGVMDMLRFQKFTVGWGWIGDYGSSDDSIHFSNLYKYSPVHSIKEGVNYPAVLVTTGDHDDRVVPAHSFKYIATLQEKHKGPNPTLIRIETMAGHGAGKPVSKIIDEEGDVWSFVFYNLGVNYKDSLL
jgi:prolyl oligopeptidase